MLPNPFGVVGIGSTISEDGKFGSTVLDTTAAIGVMGTPLVQVSKTMLGESSLVYSKQMNQFTVGFAGSYGFSGLARCEGAVAAYGGLSTGYATKETTIGYHVLMTGAVETVNLDALSPDSFVEALNAGPKNLALKALDAHLATAMALAGDDLSLVLADPQNPKYADVKTAYDAWSLASASFSSSYGAGMVIGLVWGGVGSTTLTITDDSKADTWKGGGAVNFQYAGASSSVSVDATYDASGSTDKSKISVKCTSEAIGTCALNYTDQWFNTLNGKALDALANVKPLDLPPLTAKANLPKVPAFAAPPKDQTTTANAKKVTKDSVEAASKVAAYDTLKAAYNRRKGSNDPDFAVTLAAFIKNASAAPDPKPALALKDAVAANSLSTRSLVKAGKKSTQAAPHHLQGAGGLRPSVANAAQAANVPAAPAAAGAGSGYAPIGVWITDWTALLPWLATARDNRIEDTSGAEIVLKYRMMQQDFFALSKLYGYAATLALDFDFGELATPWYQPTPFTKTSCEDIADNFANQCSKLLAIDPAHESYADKALAAYDALGDAAKQIYDRWDEIGFLRNCELGMGVLVEGGDSVQPPAQVKVLNLSLGWHLPKDQCLFGAASGNYSSFAKFQKVLPLIVPESGDIIAICSAGALVGGGIFTTQVLEEGSDPVAFWNPDSNSLWTTTTDKMSKQVGTENGEQVETCVHWDYMRFDVKAGYLEFTYQYNSAYTYISKPVQLFPVPFSAAQSVTWQGESFSTNIGSDEDMAAKLHAITDQLQSARQWDFAGDDFDSTWTADQPYSRSGVRKQYFGLIDEPPGAF